LQGKQRPNDGQASQHAMLASVKNVRLSVGIEEINSVFNCQLTLRAQEGAENGMHLDQGQQ
jgi:hypothetical protein